MRSCADLLREAQLEALSDLMKGQTLAELASTLKEGRPALFSHLKACGVDKLGDRQKLTNALAKAERLGTMRPYLDEASASSSGLASGKLLPFPYAEKAASHLANANALKQHGNEAFKAARHAVAVDIYADAIHAATEAAKDALSKAAAESLLGSLHANSAASHLKLERWADAVASASGALEVDGDNAKALYRRGMAQLRLKDRAAARRDLVRCAKVDPKNRDAREALAALDRERAAEKAEFREAFKREIARDEAADGAESEESIVEAWRVECDRLRTEQGRCVVSIGDDPHDADFDEDATESKPRFDKFDVAPISLDEFKRQRKAKAKAKAEAAKAEAEQLRERVARDARERAVRDGVDLAALDALYASLRSEGVDTADVASLHNALRARGVDPNDQEDLEDFARTYSKKNPAYGGVAWGAKPAAECEADAVDDEEEISTESMYSMSKWVGQQKG